MHGDGAVSLRRGIMHKWLRLRAQQTDDTEIGVEGVPGEQQQIFDLLSSGRRRRMEGGRLGWPAGDTGVLSPSPPDRTAVCGRTSENDTVVVVRTHHNRDWLGRN